MAEHRKRMLAVLRNRGFLLLWLGQLLSQLADRVFIYVFVIIAYQSTQTNVGVSLPMLSFGIPAVLFGPIAGVYADRWKRKRILFFTNLIRAVLILGILPFVRESLIFIFLVSFLIYTTTQFFMPAETASIPDLVPKESLMQANSLFMSTWMASFVVGFGIGAPLVHLLGEDGTFVLSAILYILATVAVAFIPRLKKHEVPAVSTIKEIGKDLIAGLEFIRRNVVVRYSLYKLFIVTSALAIISMLAVSFAKEVLGIGAKNFGYLVIFAGFGMFLGLGFLNRFSHRIKKGTVVIVGFMLSGLTFLLLAQTSDLYLSLFYCFILGVGNALVTIPIQTILQEHIPRPMRGRVFGVQTMLINSAFTFPVVIFGEIADLYGLQLVLVILGISVLVLGSLGVFVKKFRTA
jgi:predicted MFS family arabinose efflux permease